MVPGILRLKQIYTFQIFIHAIKSSKRTQTENGKVVDSIIMVIITKEPALHGASNIKSISFFFSFFLASKEQIRLFAWKS